MRTDDMEMWKRKFPKLYSKLGGFEIGSDGWFDILYDLSEKLEQLINKLEREGGEAEDDLPRAIQVKEKFGSLRFYMSHATDEMHKLIEHAENVSCSTCIKCGKKGKITNTNGWYLSLCKEHNKE